MGSGTPSNPELASVDFLEVILTDVSGIRRCRTFTGKHISGVLERGFGFPKAAYFLPPHADMILPDCRFTATGEFAVKLDGATFRKIPKRQNAGVCFGDPYKPNGEPADESPRHILMRAIAILKEEFGFDMKIGFETEFLLLSKERQQNGLPGPISMQNYSAHNDTFVYADVMEDIVKVLQEQDVDVLHFHPEGGHGHCEISTGPTDPLRACDEAVLIRVAIASTAHRHGFEVCFLPKFSDACATSGNHVHMSLYKDGVDVSQGPEPDSLAPPTQHFISGLLKHEAAWMIWAAGTPNSFRRYQPSRLTTAYTSWGISNRETMIRVIFPLGEPNSGIHFEVRRFDATVNPHVGVAALILAGILGLRSKSPLPPESSMDPGTLSDEERSARGMKLYPKSLYEAMDQFDADKDFKDLFRSVSSEDFIVSVMATRKCLADTFKGRDTAEIQSLYNKY